MALARLLILASEFPPGPGGIGAHALQMAHQLTQLGWQVELVAPQPYVTPAEREAFSASLSFPVTTLSGKNQFQRLQTIYQRSKQFQPDMLIATGERPLWIAALLSRWLGKPWLAVGHGTEFLNPSQLRRKLTHRAVRQADHVIAVSQYTAQLLGQPKLPPVTIIPNGADSARFHPNVDSSELRRRLKLGGKRILLTVGNVSERKAQDLVIRALPEVIVHYPDIVYLIAGLPTRKQYLSELAAELGVRDHVQFAGIVPAEELAAYYNLCDLFILVSREAQDGDVEGYGIVVVEAALCGKPAIVSDHGGLPEAVHHGDSGVVVPAEAPDHIAAAIVALFADQEQLQKLATNARRLALEATWSRRIADYDQILRGLVN